MAQRNENPSPRPSQEKLNAIRALQEKQWAERLKDVAPRFLDPATATPVDDITPLPTAYSGNRLLVSHDFARANADLLERLAEIAERLGWELDTSHARSDEVPQHRQELSVARLRLRADEGTTKPPDAFTLLQLARKELGVEAMRPFGLDHLVNIC
ncbi:hypothetical protein, partial [Nocardioides pocheonensis]